MKNEVIRKRGDTWTFVIDQPRGADGKRRQLRKGGYKTKKEATTAQAALITSMDKGTYVAQTKENVATFLARWLETRRSDLKPTTNASYEQLIRTHVVPKLGGLRLQDLTPQALNAFYAGMLSSGRMTGAGGALSTRTVRYVHTIIRAALKDAVRERALALNVADFAKPPRSLSTREMTVWNAVELRAFLAHVRDDRHYSMWLLAATTGMRRGELAGLRWKDVDLDRAYLAVTQTVVLVRGTVTISTPKTKASRRAIALDEASVVALRAHRQRQLEARMVAEPGTYDFSSDLVFPAPDGRPVHPESIANTFIALTKVAGLPVIRLHDLRHTYASIALVAGVHPKIVAERLGHSDVKVTLSVYSHLLPGVQEAAAEHVASMILGS